MVAKRKTLDIGILNAREKFLGALLFWVIEDLGGGAFFYYYAVFHEEAFGGYLAREGHFVGDN